MGATRLHGGLITAVSTRLVGTREKLSGLFDAYIKYTEYIAGSCTGDFCIQSHNRNT